MQSDLVVWLQSARAANNSAVLTRAQAKHALSDRDLQGGTHNFPKGQLGALEWGPVCFVDLCAFVRINDFVYLRLTYEMGAPPLSLSHRILGRIHKVASQKTVTVSHMGSV